MVRPHGVKGAVKVALWCSGPERFARAGRVFLLREGREPRAAEVRGWFAHSGGHAVLELSGVEGRDDAESLRGALVAVPDAEAEAPPEGSYFVHDLLGREAVTESGEFLGRVEELLESPANWVLVVRGPGGERLLPALKAVVVRVGPGGGPITVRPLPEAE